MNKNGLGQETFILPRYGDLWDTLCCRGHFPSFCTVITSLVLNVWTKLEPFCSFSQVLFDDSILRRKKSGSSFAVTYVMPDEDSDVGYWSGKC